MGHAPVHLTFFRSLSPQIQPSSMLDSSSSTYTTDHHINLLRSSLFNLRRMWYLTSVYSHDTLTSLPANSGLGKVCLVLPYSAVTKTPIQSESNSLRHTSFSVLSSIGLLTDQHQSSFIPPLPSSTPAFRSWWRFGKV